MYMQFAKYIFMILQQLWRTVQEDTFERSYTKVPFLLYSSYSWFFINEPVCI